jgi:hypothetical protein
VYALGCEDVSAFEVGGVDGSGGGHDPVGDACEVLDEVERPPELLVGGAGCLAMEIRGILRNRDVIMLSYIYHCYYQFYWQTPPVPGSCFLKSI